jgi:hypothetical protein
MANLNYIKTYAVKNAGDPTKLDPYDGPCILILPNDNIAFANSKQEVLFNFNQGLEVQGPMELYFERIDDSFWLVTNNNGLQAIVIARAPRRT